MIVLPRAVFQEFGDLLGYALIVLFQAGNQEQVRRPQESVLMECDSDFPVEYVWLDSGRSLRHPILLNSGLVQLPLGDQRADWNEQGTAKPVFQFADLVMVVAPENAVHLDLILHTDPVQGFLVKGHIIAQDAAAVQFRCSDLRPPIERMPVAGGQQHFFPDQWDPVQ